MTKKNFDTADEQDLKHVLNKYQQFIELTECKKDYLLIKFISVVGCSMKYTNKEKQVCIF